MYTGKGGITQSRLSECRQDGNGMYICRSLCRKCAVLHVQLQYLELRLSGLSRSQAIGNAWSLCRTSSVKVGRLPDYQQDIIRTVYMGEERCRMRNPTPNCITLDGSFPTVITMMRRTRQCRLWRKLSESCNTNINRRITSHHTLCLGDCL